MLPALEAILFRKDDKERVHGNEKAENFSLTLVTYARSGRPLGGGKVTAVVCGFRVPACFSIVLALLVSRKSLHKEIGTQERTPLEKGTHQRIVDVVVLPVTP